MEREMKFVICASKRYPTVEDRLIVEESLENGLDQGKVLYYSVHNRVVPLIWKNMVEWKQVNRFESTVRRAFVSICDTIKEKNEYVYREIERINKKFDDNKIKAVMLKGAILGPTLYEDISLREFGDVDYLVSRKDITAVEKALKEIGYVQGSFDKDKKKIILATRAEILQRKKFTHELVEFIKVDTKKPDIVHMIDINHEIFWRGKEDTWKFDTDNLLCHAKKVNTLNCEGYSLQPEYQLIQLCAHLFSEAVYFCWDKEWKRNKSEVCLYRFIDVYTLIQKEEIDWKLFTELVKINHIEEPIIFCFQCLHRLYNYSMENSDFKTDKEIIDFYYNKNEQLLKWNLALEERLFNTQLKIYEYNS